MIHKKNGSLHDAAAVFRCYCSTQQSAQTGEVMQSVESIAATSEEAAAASEQTAAISYSLAQSAEELNTSVSLFKVNTATSASPKGRSV